MKQIVIGLALAASLAACSRASATPEGVVEDLVRKTEAGDCAGLGESFSASSRQMIGPKMEEACRQGAETRKANPDKAKEKSLKTMHVLESKVEGDRATVRLQPETSDGNRAEAQTFVMVKEDGKWRIDLLATGMASGAGRGAGAGAGAPPAMGPTPPATVPPVAVPPAATPAPATDAPADEADAEEGEETK